MFLLSKTKISIVNAAIIWCGLILCIAPPATAQEQFKDKLYPRSENWSVDCRIYRIAENTVIVMFKGHDTPTEILRTSLKKVEFEDGRQVIFNRFGQIEGEITLSRPVQVQEVINPGFLRLADGEEIILNGIDFSLPTDSLGLYYFQRGTEYVRSLVLRTTVQLQFDIQQRDEFSRMIAYVILPGGLILNAEIIRLGFCPLDRGRNLIYLEDFKLLEQEAKREVRGIWSKDGH